MAVQVYLVTRVSGPAGSIHLSHLALFPADPVEGQRETCTTENMLFLCLSILAFLVYVQRVVKFGTAA